MFTIFFPAFLNEALLPNPLNWEKYSFIYLFLLQTCTECLFPGHPLFWGHSGEHGRMDARTLVEHLLEMQGESKWAKTSVNLMILGSSGGWVGNKCLIWGGKFWLGDPWMVWQREEQLLRPQVGKELVKKEKQEAGQCSWRAVRERGGRVREVEGTRSCRALVPFQVFWFSFSLSCLYHLKQASKTNQ